MVVEKIAGWEKLKTLVLDSVSSPITKRVYNSPSPPGDSRSTMRVTTFGSPSESRTYAPSINSSAMLDA
jgi:hypothetical protein